MSNQPNPVEMTMQLATGYIASACMNAVTRLKIADLLSRGPKPVAELAAATSVNEDILYRVLRALASAGFFVESEPRTFANSPASEVLRTDVPGSMWPMVLWMCDPFHFDVYRDMMPTLKDGKPGVEHVFKKQAFDVIFANEELAKVFNNAMTTFSALVIPAVLESYDFSNIGTIADIAGGHGFVLTAILKKYPQMKGILFDLDQVVAGARQRIDEMNLADRVELVAGDFFQSVPPADSYVMKHIIHDWDDEKALTILKNCAKHLKPRGKVILIEAVLSPGNEPNLGKWIDIEMFMMPGGRERTEEEFRELFAKAGLQLTRVLPTKSPLWVVEAQKV
jgi:SAM-dependent methyltransferase